MKKSIFHVFAKKSDTVVMATDFQYLRAGFDDNEYQIQKKECFFYRKSTISTG